MLTQDQQDADHAAMLGLADPFSDAPPPEVPLVPAVPAEPTTPVAPVPVPTPAVPAAAAVPAAPAPTPEPDEEVDLATGHTRSMRIKNIADPKTAELLGYIRNGMNADEAVDIFLLRNAAQEPAAAPAPAAHAGPSPLQQAQTRLTEIDAKMAEIAGQEGYVTPEYNALVLERQDLTTDIKLGERSARAQALSAEEQEQAAFNAVVEESLNASYDAYPQLMDATDPFSIAVDLLLEEAIAKKNHKYHTTLAGNPQAPLMAATLVAQAQGKAPVVKTITPASPAAALPASSPQQPQAVPVQQAPVPQPGPGLPPVAGSRGTATLIDPTGVNAAAQFQADLAAVKTEDDLSALLDSDLYGQTKAAPDYIFRG